MKKKTYAIFGLGRYGMAVARELSRSGMDVIAVDKDERAVSEAATFLPVCKCADVTDKEVIEKLDIANADTVIICMAGNLEAAVMAVALCKEAGVEKIIAKCSSEMHRKILTRVGADKVVFPEDESGTRLAKNMLSSGFIDMIALSSDVSIVEIEVKDEWAGKDLIELDLRKRYGFNIVAIRRGDRVNVNVDPESPLDKSQTLVVIANTQRLAKFS